MTSSKLIDPTLGINSQAKKIAKLLSKQKLEDIPGYPEGQYITAQTAAWYNGRERGISLKLSHYGVNAGIERPYLIITFGEHRVSDGIFIDHWTTTTPDINPPVVADFPDEAYERRWMVGYGEYEKAVVLIIGIIQVWLSPVLSVEASDFVKMAS